MSWRPEYVILLIISTVASYLSAIFMGKTSNMAKRKFFLIMSVCSNLGVLFVFKYFNFLNQATTDFFKFFSIQFSPLELSVLLPLGISFYTFQALGYTIDVYRGKKDPEKHFGIFAVYVSFFPQLVAGPIERAKNLLPQFFKKHNFDYKRVTDGLKLMLWGFFKKIVIADSLAIMVDHVYNDVGAFTGTPLIIATVFFAFQIYCDFSAYSDIAIGAAQILGFKLMKNFNRPYFSTSIRDFWRRWHISLSTWFRDYLYISLGGNRVRIPRWYLNLMIVFLIAGLWHGASWTFIIWGGLHGTYLIISLLTKKIREKFAAKIGLTNFPLIHRIIRIGITFILVDFAWIFFRANSIEDAFYVITHLFSGISFNLGDIFAAENIGWSGFAIAVGAVMFMEIVHILQGRFGIINFISKKPIWIRWSIYFIILFSILLFGVFEQTPFIYFQF